MYIVKVSTPTSWSKSYRSMNASAMTVMSWIQVGDSGLTCGIPITAENLHRKLIFFFPAKNDPNLSCTANFFVWCVALPLPRSTQAGLYWAAVQKSGPSEAHNIYSIYMIMDFILLGIYGVCPTLGTIWIASRDMKPSPNHQSTIKWSHCGHKTGITGIKKTGNASASDESQSP